MNVKWEIEFAGYNNRSSTQGRKGHGNKEAGSHKQRWSNQDLKIAKINVQETKSITLSEDSAKALSCGLQEH